MRIPTVLLEDVNDAMASRDIVEMWSATGPDRLSTVEILVAFEQTESVVAALEDRFGRTQGFRLVLTGVEATIPQVDLDEDREAEAGEGPGEEDQDQQDGEGGEVEKDGKPPPPINIEELYADVTAGVEVSWIYVVMSALSAIVAAVGLIRNDVAVVIAAMIIAPLLTPNISMSLASTLGDVKLAWRAFRVNLLGFAVAIGVSIAFGALIEFDPSVQQIAARTQLGMLEIILASAAGAAGALSFTMGKSGGVVGVMVAIALIPPAVSFGMLVGGGYFQSAWGALYMTVANLVCLNLAGVVSFFAQRIRPRSVWESERASRSMWAAMTIWAALLAILVVMLVWGGEFRRYP